MNSHTNTLLLDLTNLFVALYDHKQVHSDRELVAKERKILCAVSSLSKIRRDFEEPLRSLSLSKIRRDLLLSPESNWNTHIMLHSGSTWPLRCSTSQRSASYLLFHLVENYSEARNPLAVAV